MKTKRKSIKRKKKGGAYGLVLNVGYNDNNDVVNVKTQNILAKDDYYKVNHIHPKYSGDQSLPSSLIENIMENVNDFFHPFDTNNNKTKKKHVKIAINDTKHLTFIYLTNQIIKKLNSINVPKRVASFRIIRKNRIGEIEDTCKMRFINEYQKLLIEHATELIPEHDDMEAFDLDKSENKQERINIIRHLLKMPFLVNVISIKFGLLKNGDVTFKELYDIFNSNGLTKFLRSSKDNIFEMQRKTLNFIKPLSMSYEQTVLEENQMLTQQNEIMKKLLLRNENIIPSNNFPVSSYPTPKSSVPNSSVKMGQDEGKDEEQNEGKDEEQDEGKDEEQGKEQGKEQDNIIDPKSIKKSIQNENTVVEIDEYADFNTLLKTRYRNNKSYDDIPNKNERIIRHIIDSLEITKNQLFSDTQFANKLNPPMVMHGIYLTMIRLLLTYDMRDFNIMMIYMVDKLKSNLQQNTVNIRVKDFVTALKASFPRSVFTYTYDTIVQELENIRDWRAVIITNINKLYYLFKNYPPAYIYTMKAKSFNSSEPLPRKFKYNEVDSLNLVSI